ncbi:MAG: hypothetical protein ACT4N4_14340 [Rhodospirillales bacterium]
MPLPPYSRTMPIAALSAALLLSLGGPAQAECVCRCVGGAMRAICSNPIEPAPLCPPAACPIAPSAIRPLEPPTIAPPGASDCRPQQVLNPYTRRWEWQTLCR